MNKQEFEELFDRAFASPIFTYGFEYIGRGRSMQRNIDRRQLLFLRQSGRLTRPGTIRSVICFRHTFLRPIENDDPAKTPIYVEDCPRKLVFDDFRNRNGPSLEYRPENSGHWKIHTLRFGDLGAKSVEAELCELMEIVINRILPWADSLTAESELMQIKRFGEGAWCESRWIEDYERFLASQLL